MLIFFRYDPVVCAATTGYYLQALRAKVELTRTSQCAGNDNKSLLHFKLNPPFVIVLLT